jgi:Na+-transporting NADH:ubiquinone oxidoreductase subunit NqrA
MWMNSSSGTIFVTSIGTTDFTADLHNPFNAEATCFEVGLDPIGAILKYS